MKKISGNISNITFLVLLLVLMSGCTRTPNSKKTLKIAYEDKFLIGCALNQDHIEGNVDSTADLIHQHFNSIVAENIMKPMYLQPRQGDYQFDLSDQFVSFGNRHNMFVVGHTLVWHNQVPDWIFVDDDGHNVSRDSLINRMKDHIKTVVGRYKGKVHGWDVVNEAVTGGQGLRKSKWYEIIGEEYISMAFEFAHEADPKAELYYNDYNLFDSVKRHEVIDLVKNLQAKKVPVHGIGIQGHYALDYPDLKEFEKSIIAFSELGVDVMITELDISVLPRPSEKITAEITDTYVADPEYNPYTQSLPDSMQQKLANRYKDIFKILIKHNDKICRVTFWGVNDGDSWKNYWPVPGRHDYPLLFARDNQPKPAYDAVMNLITTDVSE